ncbi:hypothetical protein EVB78_165 [Rhizobium phage RHph_N1_15]|nr:hypothetical protein EVB77_165 [Rhizobium phage RHph_N1_10]QIG69367.1 hypothetical protein EVB78_165 [Rhizobium phage RHph_N1_15]QIG75227.1 hypothetical protein EVC15_165 [Rhizobium phage RHph_N2_6]
MGQMKRMMEAQEAARFEAEELAVKVGWMERCEEHHELALNDSSQKGRAYARAHLRVNNGETEFTYEQLKEALDYVGQNASTICFSCYDRGARDD